LATGPSPARFSQRDSCINMHTSEGRGIPDNYASIPLDVSMSQTVALFRGVIPVHAL
jgi:hypothetical protein